MVSPRSGFAGMNMSQIVLVSILSSLLVLSAIANIVLTVDKNSLSNRINVLENERKDLKSKDEIENGVAEFERQIATLEGSIRKLSSENGSLKYEKNHFENLSNKIP